MKKILCLALCGAVIATAAFGCSPRKRTETNDTEQVSISFSFWEPSVENELEMALEKIIENYEKIHPEVKVELLPTQVDGYETWLKEQFASNRAPNIISDHATNVTKYVDQDLAVDLSYALRSPTPYSDGKIWGDMFIDTEAVRGLENKGIPWFDFGMAYYYNVDLYESLELSIPDTWSEFMHNCDVIKSRGVLPITFMAQKDAAVDWLGQYISAGLCGNAIAPFSEFDKNADKKLDDDEFAELVKSGREAEFKAYFIKCQKQFLETVKEYLSFAEDAVETDENEAKKQMLDGLAGHIMTGSWDIKNLYQKNEGKNRMGIFRLPTFGEENCEYFGNNPYIGGVQGICVSNSGSEIERAAAVDFLSFLFSDEQYRIFEEETMQLPTMRGFSTGMKEKFVPKESGKIGLLYMNNQAENEYILKLAAEPDMDLDAAAEELYLKCFG